MPRQTRLIVLLFATASTVALAEEVSQRQIGEMVLQGVPEWPNALRTRMLQYLNVRTAALHDVSDNGDQVLIGTRFGESSQLHLVSQPMGCAPADYLLR